jgi:hypothetical protein
VVAVRQHRSRSDKRHGTTPTPPLKRRGYPCSYCPEIFRKTRQAKAFALLRAGNRPGALGVIPRRRNQPLKARASASSKLQSLRQVIESEMLGSVPFCT